VFPDHLCLLKLVWDPDHIDGDKVLPSAFRKEELVGDPAVHCSVDRSDTASRKVMEQTAASQKEKADGVNHKRHDAFIGVLSCGKVRSLVVEDTNPLEVISDPLPENPAHCGIRNSSGRKNRAFVNELRGKLAKMASPPRTFDQVYQAA